MIPALLLFLLPSLFLQALLPKPWESQDVQFKNHSSGGNIDWFKDLPHN